MKNIRVTETEHSKLNARLKLFLRKVDEDGVYFKFKLADRLKERNLSVRECAKYTGLRIATISDMMNGNKSSINLHHVLVIMICLRISRFEDIVEIHLPDNMKVQFDAEAYQWILREEVPTGLLDVIDFWNGKFDYACEE